MVAVAERCLQLGEAGLDRRHGAGAQLRFQILVVEEEDHLGEARDHRFDGVERGEGPGQSLPAVCGVLRQEMVARLGDAPDDGAGFEHRAAVHLDRRDLGEGLASEMLRLQLLLVVDQPGLVGQFRLVERPANPKVADMALGEGRHPVIGGDDDTGSLHGNLPFRAGALDK